MQKKGSLESTVEDDRCATREPEVGPRDHAFPRRAIEHYRHVEAQSVRCLNRKRVGIVRRVRKNSRISDIQTEDHMRTCTRDTRKSRRPAIDQAKSLSRTSPALTRLLAPNCCTISIDIRRFTNRGRRKLSSKSLKPHIVQRSTLFVK